MKIRRYLLLATPVLIARDNEGGGDPAPADPAGDPAPNNSPDTGNVQFNEAQQAKVNEIVQKRVKAMRTELETSERRYEQLLQNQNLTAQERDEIATELERVQTSLRTKEQQAAYEAKKREAEFNKKYESATEQANRFKSLFETQTRNNAIISAAQQADAFNPDLFIDVLAPRTEIVEVENEQGEKTGQFATKVRISKKAEDGTVTEALVDPSEAIEDMKNQPEKFGGLFRGNVAKGIGQGSNSSFSGNQRADITKISDEEYFQNRDQYAKQYGIRTDKSRF